MTPYCRGIETVGGLRKLRELIVHGCPAGDFRFLGEKPALDFLRLEMKRRAAVSSHGLAGAPQGPGKVAICAG
jgi:hypothetical protein